MNMHKVNLAQGVVPNAAERKKRYLLMLGYFTLCACLLVEGGYRMYQRYVETKQAEAEIVRLEKAFRDSHPDGGNLASYAGVLKARVQMQQSQIMTLKREVPTEEPMAQLLYHLMDSVPETGELLEFEYNKESNAVDVTCQLVVNDRRAVGHNELLRLWRGDEELFKLVKSVRLLDLEENLFVQGHPAVVLHSRIELL